jgi:hypothetical protein
LRYADLSDPASWAVRALIQHRSGVQSAQLFYTTDLNGVWSSIEMTADATTPDYWLAELPTQTEGATVYYYIQATAQNGKTLTRPMPAPEGYWHFKVLETSSVPAVAIAEMPPLFPNPARSITAVPVDARAKTAARLLVLNALGQEVEIVFEGTLGVGRSHFFIHAERYVPGVYQVVLQTAGQQLAQKWVVKGE